MLSLQHCQTVRLADEGQEKVTTAMGLGQHWSRREPQAMRGQAAHHPDTFTLPAPTAVSFVAFVGDGSLLSTHSPWKCLSSLPRSPLPLSAPWLSRT